VSLFGLATLAEHLFGWNPGFDKWIVWEPASASATHAPEGPRGPTALAFALIGAALLLLDRQTRRGRCLFQYAVLAAGLVSLLVFLGHLYGVPALEGMGSPTPMAVHTNATFLLLCSGILCARPDRGLMAAINGDSPGGFMARWLLPAAVVIPILIGWIRLAGQRAGFYDTGGGLSLQVAATIIVMAVLIYGNGRSLDRMEAERQHLMEELECNAKELERSNQDLQEFALVASHDLQEPLRKILAFSDHLKSRAWAALDETSRDFLQRIQNAAARMLSLIESILELARVQAPTQPFQPIDLGAVVREVIADLEVRLRDTRGRAEVGPLPTVSGDPTQIRQLFQNLIANAIKFHKAEMPPVVVVKGQPLSNGYWEIAVSDNGIGFEVQHIDRVFRPFHRLHGRGEYEGCGMGLAICRKIAARHGGDITARSAPGAGSVFVTTLPGQAPEERRVEPRAVPR
jgi:signal transduction histidine kinase